jgi:DNA-binding transcriptional LysR family regulator
MRNVPTELLRAFVTVIDLKGYTRAGERLGRSQPAISLQIKRLQDLLGVPLFERDGTGSTLTEQGQLVANYARRMLALNDELVVKLSRKTLGGRIRIGMPNDYADHFLPRLLADGTARQDGAGFDVVCDLSVNLLAGFRDGLYDLVVAMTADGPAEDAYMTWRQPLAWVGEPDVACDQDGVIRLVAYPESCHYRRSMLAALQREGRPYEIVYTSPSLAGLEAALTTGFGVTVLSRDILPPKLAGYTSAEGMPALPDLVAGIYIRRDKKSADVENLAARLADLFGQCRMVA